MSVGAASLKKKNSTGEGGGARASGRRAPRHILGSPRATASDSCVVPATLCTDPPRCRSFFVFFSSRRRHTRLSCDWSSHVCSSDRSEEHTSELQTHDNLGCRRIRSEEHPSKL